MPAAPALTDLACPKCGYALHGLPTHTCPECGLNFDPEVLRWRVRYRRRRAWLFSLAIMAFALYSPFSWLLWIDYPLSDYHWFWLRLWPILPGLPATILLRSVMTSHMPEWMEMVCMGLVSAVLLLFCTWLGARGRWWLVITAAIVLALSCFNGWVGYQLFQL